MRCSAGRTRGWTSGSRRPRSFAEALACDQHRRSPHAACAAPARSTRAHAAVPAWRDRLPPHARRRPPPPARSAASGRGGRPVLHALRRAARRERSPLPAVRRVPGRDRPILHLLRPGAGGAGRDEGVRMSYWLLVTGYSWPASDRRPKASPSEVRRRVRFSGRVSSRIRENASAEADPTCCSSQPAPDRKGPTSNQ